MHIDGHQSSESQSIKFWKVSSDQFNYISELISQLIKKLFDSTIIDCLLGLTSPSDHVYS